MNPFEEINNINTVVKSTQIIICVKQNGRKHNTYISGWNIPDKDLSDHLKNIKKKRGCNGTIKMMDREMNDITLDTDDKDIIQVMMFQGDHSSYIEKYLIEQGVNNEDIYTKG